MIQCSVAARPVSRRQVLGGAGALGLSAFTLPACSAQQGTSGSATGTPRRGGTLTFAANASSAKEKLDPQQANGPSGYLRNVSVFGLRPRPPSATPTSCPVGNANASR